MQSVDYANFDFGERLNGFIHEVMNYGGAPQIGRASCRERV